MEKNKQNTFDYQSEYDGYWSRLDRVGESSADLDQTADQIVMSCGLGKTLDIGSGEGALVAALLRRGVDAHGLDVSEVVVSRCNQRIPARFTLGSVLSLPYQDSAFHTIVSTDCMEHLAPEDVPVALKEIHRVAGRYVFLNIATTQDRDNHWHLTVEGRAWWEGKCFEAGFRKHPAYYRINTYESLNQDSWQITILLEKISAKALDIYPLAALKEERDLHMDMLREYGSRSDAHVSRYHFASNYIRPGDVVLDAACGLGYGSYVIHNLTKCSKIIGIDGSKYGIDYANDNFSSNSAIQFMQGLLPGCLDHIPDNSIDSIICFETLEHVEAPSKLLAAFNRILTPGGRLISSVPHDWSDETGKDPNPYHLHVYNFAKFNSELTQFFDIEHMVGQTADRIKKPGEGCEWVARPRSFNRLNLQDENATVEAEWLLAVTCKSPLNGAEVPYVEKVFSKNEMEASGNVLAFARDYENPWLIRSLVSIGLRTENSVLRAHWAGKIIREKSAISADYGAALCVLAYLALENATVIQQSESALIKDIDCYISNKLPGNPNVLRWQVSLSYVRALMELAKGHHDAAKEYFQRVIAFPSSTYSPTLLTKSAEAAYMLGILYVAENEIDKAILVWQTTLCDLQKSMAQYLNLQYTNLPPRFELREVATVFSLLEKLGAAASYAKGTDFKFGVFYDEVNADMLNQLAWLKAQCDAWQKLAVEREHLVSTLVSDKSWLLSERDAWQKLAIKREQLIAMPNPKFPRVTSLLRLAKKVVRKVKSIFLRTH